MAYQKTFQTMLMTPLSPFEIVFGEIMWSTSKGFFGVCGVILVGTFMGLVDTWRILPLLPVLLVICWMFASMGMVVTSWAKNYDSFIYATSGFITPMTMLAGVYFPIEQLPNALRYFSFVLPLTQATQFVRQVLDGTYATTTFLYLGVMILIAFACQNLAMKRIRRKLVS